MIRQCRHQSGFSLLEMAMAMGLTGLLMGGIWQIMGTISSQQDARTLATQASAVATAVQNYINENTSTILSDSGLSALNSVICLDVLSTDSCTTTLTSLQAGGYLPSAFANRNSYGQSYSVYLKREDAGTLSSADTGDRIIGLVLTTGGTTISDSVGSRLVAMVGAPGGFIYSGSSSASGLAGGWSIDFTAVTGSVGWRTTPGTAAASSGHLALLTNLVMSTAGGGSGGTATSSGSGATDIDGLSDGLTAYGNSNLFMGTSAGNGSASGSGNTGVGYLALNALTTGSNNTALGPYTLSGLTDGDDMLAIGPYAINAASHGDGNIAVGRYALASYSTAAGACYWGADACLPVAIGDQAGRNTANALGPILIGTNAGMNSDVSNLVAIGYDAGKAGLSDDTYAPVAIGNYAYTSYANDHTPSVAVGNYALNSFNSDCFSIGASVAIGHEANRYNSATCAGTALGYQTLRYETSTNGYNTAMGYQALGYNASMTGDYNTAFGSYALKANTQGDYGVGFGYNALATNTTGDYNTAFGSMALAQNDTQNYLVAVGYGALTAARTATAEAVAVGAYASYSSGNTDAGNGGNTSIGYKAAYTSPGGNALTAIGSKALELATTGTDYNVAIGYMAANAAGSSSASDDNSVVGSHALEKNASGRWNTVFGAYAMQNDLASESNVAFGYNTLKTSSAVGSYNTAFGALAMRDHASGTNNVALGYSAMRTGGGSYNVVAGYQAYQSGTGGYNVIVGKDAAINVGTPSISASMNVVVGSTAGATLTTGYSNTLVGNGANVSSGAAINRTAIGNGASATADNSVVFGNASITSIGGPANWSNFSDRRIKTDILPIDLGLDFIMALRPVKYHLINGNGRQDYGFIAQEVEQALAGRDSNLITRLGDDDRTYTMAHDELIAPMIKAMQEGHAMLQTSQTRLQSLVSHVQLLREQTRAASPAHTRMTGQQLDRQADDLDQLRSELANQQQLINSLLR